MALICHCAGVRDRTIVRAIRHGASTVEDVRDACGAGSGCGGCVGAVQALLDRHAPVLVPAAPRLAVRAG